MFCSRVCTMRSWWRRFPGTSVTVNMRVIRNHDVTSEDGSEKISANNFYVDLEDVENLDDKEIVALSNAQAWETESDEYISIANIEYELEAKRRTVSGNIQHSKRNQHRENHLCS